MDIVLLARALMRTATWAVGAALLFFVLVGSAAAEDEPKTISDAADFKNQVATLTRDVGEIKTTMKESAANQKWIALGIIALFTLMLGLLTWAQRHSIDSTARAAKTVAAASLDQIRQARDHAVERVGEVTLDRQAIEDRIINRVEQMTRKFDSPRQIRCETMLALVQELVQSKVMTATVGQTMRNRIVSALR